MLIVGQQVKKFSVLYRTRNLIAIFTETTQNLGPAGDPAFMFGL
jgi:hypothetical protein